MTDSTTIVGPLKNSATGRWTVLEDGRYMREFKTRDAAEAWIDNRTRDRANEDKEPG